MDLKIVNIEDINIPIPDMFEILLIIDLEIIVLKITVNTTVYDLLEPYCHFSFSFVLYFLYLFLDYLYFVGNNLYDIP